MIKKDKDALREYGAKPRGFAGGNLFVIWYLFENSENNCFGGKKGIILSSNIYTLVLIFYSSIDNKGNDCEPDRSNL